MKNFLLKSDWVRNIQIAAFIFLVLGGLLGGHRVFAAGNVQPGGICSTDLDCADQGTQSYGCYKNPSTAATGTCTPDGDATAAQTQAQAAAQAACAAAAADPENKAGQGNCQTATANAQSATPNAATTAGTAATAAQTGREWFDCIHSFFG